MNWYAILADLVALVHLGYVSFVVLGELLILVGIWLRWQWVRNFTFRIVHLGAIGFVVFEAVIGMTCPLTTWENQLRALAGQQTKEEGFIAAAVHRVMFFELPPWVFTMIYISFGALVLATLIFAPPRRRGVAAQREIKGKTNSV